jgi:tetratricopeptide (TPR) repeat protein
MSAGGTHNLNNPGENVAWERAVLAILRPITRFFDLLDETVNLNVAALLLVSSLVIGFGVYFSHRVQVSRNAREIARVAQAKGRLSQAEEYLKLYLSRNPGDTTALEDYADLLKNMATVRDDEGKQLYPTAGFTAYVTLEQVLRRDEQRDDLRRQLALVALELGRITEARKYLETLLQKASSPDSALEELLSRCYLAAGDLSNALTWLRKAVGHAPSDIDRYERLAEFLRARMHDSTAADQTMDDMVAANSHAVRAHLLSLRYRLRLRLPGALRDWTDAYALAPDDAEVLLASAQVASEAAREHKLFDARVHLQRGILLYPNRTPFYLALAATEMHGGQVNEAIACVRQGLGKAQTQEQQNQLRFALADLLIEIGRWHEAEVLIAELRQAELYGGFLDYLEGHLLAKQERIQDARPALERARAYLQKLPELVSQIDLYLADCHEVERDTGPLIAAYQRSIAANPLNLQARIRLAAAWLNSGKSEEAVAELRQVLSGPHAPPRAAFLFIQALILHNLRLPPDQRTWSEVENILQEVTGQLPDSADIPLLQAELLRAQGRATDVRSTLQRACDHNPAHAELWAALADWIDQQGDREAAAQILDRAEAKLGDQIVFRLARARYWGRHAGPDTVRALDELARNADRFGPVDEERLIRELAQAHARIGNVPQAERLYTGLLDKHPSNVRIALVLLDFALQTGNDATFTRVEQMLGRSEGTEKWLWNYCALCRALAQARQGRPFNSEEARGHLAELTRQRPEWTQLKLIEAELDECDGHILDAVDIYESLLRSSNPPAGAMERLLALLYTRGKYAEVDHAIRSFVERTTSSGTILRASVELSLRAADPVHALDWARLAARREPENYRNQIFFGLSLWAAGEKKEAEAALRRATEFGPQHPETWAVLVDFLVDTNQQRRAMDVIAETKAKLPASEAGPALAHCYETIGMGGSYPQLREALSYFDGVAGRSPADLTPLRIKARLLASRVPFYGEAIRLYEQISSGQALTAPEEISLVRLYEARRDWANARRHADKLLAADPQSLTSLAHAARSAIEQQSFEEAGRFASLMEKHHPAAYETVEIKARLLQGERNLRQAVRVVEDFVEKQHPANLTPVAALLEELGDAAAAEKMLRRQLTIDKQPRAILALAGFLARYQRTDEALGLYESIRSSVSAEVLAGAAVAALGYAAPLDAKHCQRVDSWLSESLARNQKQPTLCALRGDLKLLQGRRREAEAHYRESLSQDAANVWALGNLAWLLAHETGKENEALELLQRAEELAGPQAALLDARAQAKLGLSRTNEALLDVRAALEQSPTPPSYFHLAQAFYQMKNYDAARKSLRKAIAAQPHRGLIHPLEMEAYTRLRAGLEGKRAISKNRADVSKP